MALILMAGCHSANPRPAVPKGSLPNLGPPMQDVRSEIAVQNAELEYNAAKNSRPTHQYEAEREAAKKRAEEKKKQDATTARKAAEPKP